MSNNVDVLSDLFEKNCQIIDPNILKLIDHDMDTLANYYGEIINNIDNCNFVIDPIPELDLYLDENSVKTIYSYLTYEKKGYHILFNKIGMQYQIIPDKLLTDTLLDYYFDYLLNYY